MFRAFILSLLLVGPASADLQHPTQGALPDRADIPFELAERLIVVQATVNGVSGKFLLDSGSPTIILNRPHFNEGQITTKALNHGAPSGAGGAMHQVEAADGLVLSFGDITLTGQQGLVADLTHLAKNVGIEVIALGNALEGLWITRLGPDVQAAQPCVGEGTQLAVCLGRDVSSHGVAAHALESRQPVAGHLEDR